MILLVDADSLIFAACYKKRENPEDDKYYRDIEEAQAKFDEQFMSIVNKLEDMYPVEKVLTFSGSKGNFRKLITSDYKANRKKQIQRNKLGRISGYFQITFHAHGYNAKYEK